MKFSLHPNPAASEVAIYSDLKHFKSSDHFIAENEKVITSLLESDIEIISLYLTEEHFVAKREAIEQHQQESEAKIFLASKKEMGDIVGFSLHQGILAAAKIPSERSLAEVIATRPKPQLFVILDEITDAENMGALYRTALAMNTTAIIIDAKSTSPWMRRSVRVSMGAVFFLPTLTVGSLPQAMEELRESGVRTYAATINLEATALYASDLSRNVGLVFGSEGFGVKPEVVAACDGELTLPMPNEVDSLNVAIAQGIFLYEVQRQRALQRLNE